MVPGFCVSEPLRICHLLDDLTSTEIDDFVTFPNGVFSGVIISSVTKGSKDTLLATGEWQLLLGALALPGVFLGAWLCNIIGRKNTMVLGFSGYLVFGLIIGCAYDKITKIVPLFVVFYGLMLSSGNMGPGDMLGLVSSESYATAVRGTCYGVSAAVGKAVGYCILCALGQHKTRAKSG